MLSETFVLRKALEEAGLTMPQEHPRVKSPGASTGPCLRVLLNQDGSVTDVASISRDEWSGLWTVMEGNQNSFPVVRIKQPLILLPRESAIWSRLGFDDAGKRKKKPDAVTRIQVLADALANQCGLISRKTEQDWKRLDQKSKELLEYSSPGETADETLPRFATRFRCGAVNPSRLLYFVGTQSVQRAQEGRLNDDALDAIEMLILGKGPPNTKGEPAKMTIQLAFDLDGHPEGSYRLYSQQIRKRVIEVLPAEQGKRKQARRQVVGESAAKRCAFTGQEAELQTTAFPSVNLRVLNKAFPLVSMFSEAPCNTRYGLTDAFVVPVAKEAARRMANALTYILSAEREGRTWRGVASGKFATTGAGKRERRDLLIVYVEGKPNIDAMVAEIFGVDEGQQQKQFEVDSQAVCAALDGVEKAHPGSTLNLFILRKASEGQVHIVVAASPTVKEVIEAAGWWQQAATNVPNVSLRLPATKEKEAIPGRTRAPFPDQIVRLLAQEWVTKGTRSNKVEGIGLAQVLDLMLRKPGKGNQAARQMLDLALRRTGPLLLGVFGATKRAGDPKRWSGYPRPSCETALLAVSTLGILLDSLGATKENYMKEAAFQIGQMLALAPPFRGSRKGFLHQFLGQMAR